MRFISAGRTWITRGALVGAWVHFALGGAAAWAEASAEVTFVVGKVFIVNGSQSTPALKGSILHMGESLRTSKKSMAIVTLNEGSKVKVNENSEISAAQLDEGAANGEDVNIGLESGSVFAKVIKRQQSHFRIRTKTATMGVRGTEFFTALATGPTQDVWMCVNEGAVEVESTTEGRKVLVNEGNGLVIAGGKKLTKPQPYAWTSNLNWNMNPAKGGVVNKLTIDSSYIDLLRRDYD